MTPIIRTDVANVGFGVIGTFLNGDNCPFQPPQNPVYSVQFQCDYVSH